MKSEISSRSSLKKRCPRAFAAGAKVHVGDISRRGGQCEHSVGASVSLSGRARPLRRAGGFDLINRRVHILKRARRRRRYPAGSGSGDWSSALARMRRVR